jgi:hypothetical protein
VFTAQYDLNKYNSDRFCISRVQHTVLPCLGKYRELQLHIQLRHYYISTTHRPRQAFINYFSGFKNWFASTFKKIIYNTVQLFVSGFSAPVPSFPSPYLPFLT